MKNNKVTKLGIGVALLLLAVGFAAVATTLYINGTAVIKANTSDFENNVIFTSATAENGTAQVATGGKSFTFTTSAFKNIGDSDSVEFTIANNSQYAAKFKTPAIVCTADNGHTTNYGEYLTVTPGTELNGKTVAKQGTIDGSLSISMKKSYVGDDLEIKYTCTIDVDAVEA